MRAAWLVLLAVSLAGCGAPTSERPKAGKSQPTAAKADSSLVGEWIAVDNEQVGSLSLVLNSDGTFTVGDATGTYKVLNEGGRIVELKFSDAQQCTLRLATDKEYGVMYDDFGVAYCRKGDEAKAKEFLEKRGEDGAIAN